MSIKHAMMPWVSAALTSDALLKRRRQLHELGRRLRGADHQATCYLRLNDPYSWLLAQALPALAAHFDLKIRPVTMLWLEETMYPEPEMLARLAPQDAARLAALHGLHFPATCAPPAEDAVLLASRQLIAAEGSDQYWPLFNQLAQRLWSGEQDIEKDPAVSSEQAWQTLIQRREHFLRAGHYLTATVHYAGEWYWGIDRLDHLTSRLAQLTGISDPALPDYGAAKYLATTPGTAAPGQQLDFFFSFRSPYSRLALQRTFQLADRYQLKLNIRPVLPMVMRGLSVPRAKRLYILRDAAREAKLHGVPFGKVCDPLGAGVERCMAIWPLAEQQGRSGEWLLTASEGIWSRGINTANDQGLKQLVEQAGLDWQQAQQFLDNDHWRGRAEQNREAMMAAGSWGVPTFVLDNQTIWGQDRFAIIEAIIRREPDSTTNEDQP